MNEFIDHQLNYLPPILLCMGIAVLLLTACNQNEKNSPEEKKRPNIMVILADDMGFSDIGSYGGEVHTPAIDALAEGGIRFTQFYNNARCCPTRASLITGLYPHQAGMGWMTAADLGTPQYQGELNKKSVTLAEVLGSNGYETYMTGKWHLSRVRNVKSGIKDNWPMQRGFEHYFGIIDGAANYFHPALYSGNTTYDAPDSNFYLTHAISDSTVRFIDDHFKEKDPDPFFMYVAYTSPHWPLHALQKDIDKYKKVYTMGWDSLRRERMARQKKLGLFVDNVELSDRDDKVPAWNELSKAQQDEFVSRMAIYAAQIDAMDQGISKIVEKLKSEKQLDNTLIFFLSDNGACAEFISSGKSKVVDGTADSFESYRINWANASSTPYREYKHWIQEGGIATPLIIHWPEGVKSELDGTYIREPGHIIDIMSTIVDVAGANYPKQYNGHTIQPMEGQSLLPEFQGKALHHQPIFWEHEANIGVRDGQWKLVAKTKENEEFDPATLELYDMQKDPSELHDLAATNPEKRDTMYSQWEKWAQRIKVFPMDTRGYGLRAREYQRQVNGEFDEGLAGWTLPADTLITCQLDTTGAISGKNSARFTRASAGSIKNNPLRWSFFANAKEKFDISFMVKGDNGNAVKLVFENKKGEVVGSKMLECEGSVQKATLRTVPVKENGMCHISFYLDQLTTNSPVWIDDVTLKSVD